MNGRLPVAEAPDCFSILTLHGGAVMANFCCRLIAEIVCTLSRGPDPGSESGWAAPDKMLDNRHDRLGQAVNLGETWQMFVSSGG